MQVSNVFSQRIIRGMAMSLGMSLTMIFSTSAMAQFAAVRVAESVTGNTLSRPVFVTSAPGDYRRVFIVERTGRIRVLDTTTTPNPTLLSTPFLDFSSRVVQVTNNNQEYGFLGLAFHPQYTTNGKFYVYYTSNSGTNLPANNSYFCVVAEYTNPTPAGNVADPLTFRTLIQIPHPQSNHNGGWLAFGPDNQLYFSIGDGGGGGDGTDGALNHNPVIGNGLDSSVLLGKILRINPNVTTTPAQGPITPGTTASYGIPSDNPVIPLPANATGTVSRSEIWAYGLRNPFRNSFDRLTGDLWIADVGQGNWEELNFQPALTAGNASSVGGRNYGWRRWEGFQDYNCNGSCVAGATAADPGFSPPIGVYSHAQGLTAATTPAAANWLGTNTGTFSGITGVSIIGGYVYRGCQIPEIYGQYLFTDYNSGRIYNTTRNAAGTGVNICVDNSTAIYGGAATTPAIPTYTRPSGAVVSFGEDAYGEIFFIDQTNARIYKIVSTATGRIPLANADFNRDGLVSVQDVLDFITAWLGLDPRADFNRTGGGTAGITVQDLLDYFSAWLRGCPG